MVEFHESIWPEVKYKPDLEIYEAFMTLIRRACEIADFSNEHLYRISLVFGKVGVKYINHEFRITEKEYKYEPEKQMTPWKQQGPTKRGRIKE